jgi:tetratricopeptide (TPR) repeat protein
VNSFILIIATFFLVSVPRAQALPNIDKLADQAKYAEIVSVCNKAIQKNDKDWKAYGIRGWAYSHLNKNLQTIEDCNHAIALKKDFARAFRYRACAKQDLKQHKGAVADASKAISLAPNSDVWAYKTRGISLCYLKKYEQAIENLNQAIELANGKHPEFYGDRGWIYGMSGQWQREVEDCTICLRHMPKNVCAYYQRAFANLKLKKYQETINDCSIAIKIDPKYSEAYMTRASALERLCQYKAQMDDLKVALSLKPNDAWILHVFGYANLDQGKNQTAIENANHALHLNPKDGEAFFQRARAHFNLGQDRKCVEDCTTAIMFFPNEYANYKFRGLAYSRLKDRRAIEDLKQAALIMPKNEHALENLAWCYCDFEMHKERIEALTQQISLSPKVALPYFQRSVSHLRLKEYESSINDSNSYLKLVHPDDVIAGCAYWRIGEAQCKLGRFDESIESCTKALDLFETSEIYDIRATARQQKGEIVFAAIDRMSARLTEHKMAAICGYAVFINEFRKYFQSNN